MKFTPFFILILLTFFSCKKNKEEQIIITTIEKSPEQNSITLDINKDGASDLKIRYDHIKVNGPEFRSRYKIICLNPNLELSGYIKTDTLFLNKNFSSFTDSLNQSWTTETYKYTYQRLSSSDSVVNFQHNQFKLKFTESGQLSTSDNSFSRDSLILYEQPAHSDFFITLGAKSFKVQSYYYYSNNEFFAVNEIKYIRFNLKSKKGWIKLSISQDLKLTVYEMAIHI